MVERLKQEYNVEVQWRAFELHPEIPPEGGTLGYDPERTRSFRRHIIGMAQQAGMEMRFADLVSNSRLALEAAEFARDQGKLEAFHDGVFGAYFRDTKNIGDAGVLLEIGDAAGLDRESLRDALDRRAYSEKVEYQIDMAKRLNIAAVPTFIFDNKFMVQGAQPYDVFKRVMEEHVLPERESKADG